MKTISLAELKKAANAASIRVELFEEGTFRLTPAHLVGCMDGRTGACRILEGKLSCYLCGREKWPPLHGFTSRKIGSAKELQALRTSRCVKLTSGAELKRILAKVAQLGWCVDQDIYVFDQSGRWMIYAGHDDFSVYLASH